MKSSLYGEFNDFTNCDSNDLRDGVDIVVGSDKDFVYRIAQNNPNHLVINFVRSKDILLSFYHKAYFQWCVSYVGWLVSVSQRQYPRFSSPISYFKTFFHHLVSMVVQSFLEEMTNIQVNAVYIADMDAIAFPNNYDEDSVTQRADFESALTDLASLANLFILPSNSYYTGFYGFWENSETVRSKHPSHVAPFCH